MSDRIRYAWVVCVYCADLGGLCPYCAGTRKVKAELIRVAAGSGAKSGRTGIKMTAEDKVWARQVKQRDHHRCIRCGRGSPDWQVHAAHIFGRRSKATRTNLDNGLTLCVECHKWNHENPAEFKQFVIEEIGQTAYDELQQLAESTQKRVKRPVA